MNHKCANPNCRNLIEKKFQKYCRICMDEIKPTKRLDAFITEKPQPKNIEEYLA